MEKNRIRPIKAGKSVRMSYSRQKEVLEMPNLIEVQKDSYQWFLDEGLKEVFADISPIADYSGQLSLEFVDFTLCEDDVKYSIAECKERDATYAAPLKVKVRFYNKEAVEEVKDYEIFMGDLPLMTETGTFVINGAERVIVSQLVRSPGIYYGIAHDKVGKTLYSCTVIPNRGAWLEYETDSNDVFYVRVDRTRKVPVTVLIRALGIGTNQEIIDLFGEEPKIVASFGKDTATNYQEGLLELYKKIRPGEPLTVESAESLINAMFFDPRRYDLAKVGRYKFNKKLALKNRISGQVLAEDVVDASTGEILAESGTLVTRELAESIQNAAVPFVWIQGEERNIKVLSNMMVDVTSYVDIDKAEAKKLGITELVYYPVLEKILPLGEYVPNDLELKCNSTDATQFMILTGPNMAGKSTYMRQNALIAILAQIGSWVPADFTKIGVIDKIFTRVGASDDLTLGQSTFMVEMIETACILNSATDRSFILLDEIGRGTSTYDGVAIAWSVAEYIATKIKARCIFATHYHELNVMTKTYPQIKNYRITITEENGEIEFLRKIVQGGASKSYGIQVAKMAGLPSVVIKRSQELMTRMQKDYSNNLATRKKSVDAPTVDVPQLNLFN